MSRSNQLLLTLMLAMLAAALALPLRAEIVRDLYSATVSADDRSQNALQAASREALAQVLVKVSGSQQVLRNPAVDSALSGARNLVQQYSFVGENADGGVDVRFEFDGPSMVELVTAAGEPLWTANRPVVLVWLVQETSGGATFVSRDSEPQLAEALFAAFGRRGVPLQLPLFDLADTAALRPQEVARLYQPAVELASRRYNRDFILVGSAQFSEAQQYTVNWAFIAEGERYDASASALDLAAAMDRGAGLAADIMADRFAVAPTGERGEGVLISVAGVTSYADYAAVLSWLESVELIDRVRVVRIDGERLQLRLLARADAEQLAGIIGLNERFVAVPSGYTEEQLSYRWTN